MALVAVAATTTMSVVLVTTESRSGTDFLLTPSVGPLFVLLSISLF